MISCRVRNETRKKQRIETARGVVWLRPHAQKRVTIDPLSIAGLKKIGFGVTPIYEASFVPPTFFVSSVAALIIGGAEQALDEYRQAKKICTAAHFAFATFAVNDMVVAVPDRIHHAVSLHPHKVDTWLAMRKRKGFLKPDELWLNRPAKSGTRAHIAREWNGSVGLFAVKIALEKGFRKIILCGVPMTSEAKHFLRHADWHAATMFRGAWERHREEMRPYVRSFSGWTAELLGTPSLEFMRE
jgi:hypothetical protein